MKGVWLATELDIKMAILRPRQVDGFIPYLSPVLRASLAGSLMSVIGIRLPYRMT